MTGEADDYSAHFNSRGTFIGMGPAQQPVSNRLNATASTYKTPEQPIARRRLAKIEGVMGD